MPWSGKGSGGWVAGQRNGNGRGQRLVSWGTHVHALSPDHSVLHHVILPSPRQLAVFLNRKIRGFLHACPLFFCGCTNLPPPIQ